MNIGSISAHLVRDGPWFQLETGSNDRATRMPVALGDGSRGDGLMAVEAERLTVEAETKR